MAGTDPATQAQRDFIADLQIKAGDESNPLIDTRDRATAEITRLKQILSDQVRAARQGAENARTSRERRSIAQDFSAEQDRTPHVSVRETTRDGGGAWKAAGFGGYDAEPTGAQIKAIQGFCRRSKIPFVTPPSKAHASCVMDIATAAKAETAVAGLLRELPEAEANRHLDPIPRFARAAFEMRFIERKTRIAAGRELGASPDEVDRHASIAALQLRRTLVGDLLAGKLAPPERIQTRTYERPGRAL